MTDDAMREDLAEYAHKVWTRWMVYLFSKSMTGQDGEVTIPIEWVTRWKRQIATPYDELSKSEKDSDRIEADNILYVLEKDLLRGHAGDCTIYKTIEGTDNCWAGLCNCGYGALCQRKGDFSHAISKEKLESMKNG